jgi:hypothetical protein
MQQLGDSQPTLSHIKGHQDAIRPLEELSLKAQLNCRADKLAEQYLTEFPDIDAPKSLSYPLQAASCTSPREPSPTNSNWNSPMPEQSSPPSN